MAFKLPSKPTRDFLKKVAGRLAFKLQRVIKERIPRRFRNRVAVNETQNGFKISINDEIFQYWELGTRRHRIEARPGSALKFKWPNHPPEIPPMTQDGSHIFKGVNHPGTEGHFVLDEIEKDTQLINRLLEEAIKETK